MIKNKIKAKRKTKKKIISCKYCIRFDVSKDRRRELIGVKVVIFERYCPVLDKYVGIEEEACKEFLKAEYFVCDKDSNRLRFEVCINRQNKNNTGCVRCKQGNAIKEIMDDKHRKCRQ